MRQLLHGSIGLRLLLITGLFSLATGCSTGPAAPTTKQATVSGSVSKDGKPIKLDSAVTFFCADAGATLGGKIDALGKFSLTPADPSIGIPVGRYKVMVRPPEPPPAAVGTKDYEKAMMQGGATVAPPAPAASEIPQPFQALDSTPLVLEVKEGANTFDIDLAKISS